MSEYDLHRKTNLPSQVALRSATKSFTPSAEIPDSQLTDLLVRRVHPRPQGSNTFCNCAREFVQRMFFATKLLRFESLGMDGGLSTAASRTFLGQIWPLCCMHAGEFGGQLLSYFEMVRRGCFGSLCCKGFGHAALRCAGGVVVV